MLRIITIPCADKALVEAHAERMLARRPRTNYVVVAAPENPVRLGVTLYAVAINAR